MNLYAMNEFRDYYYGYMMPDTGDLKYFALYLYQGGIVLQMPLKDEPEKVPLNLCQRISCFVSAPVSL